MIDSGENIPIIPRSVDGFLTFCHRINWFLSI